MRLQLFIALRYLFAKKRQQLIQLISRVSVAGIAIATAAMICTMSVFNGFTDVVASMCSLLDPDVRLTPQAGKVFVPDSMLLATLAADEAVISLSSSLENNAMIEYKEQQRPCLIKGVDSLYASTVEVDSVVIDGTFILNDPMSSYANLGAGLAMSIGCRAGFVDPLSLYAPKRTGRINVVNPSTSFRIQYPHIGSAFVSGQQEKDENLVIIPLAMARTLFGYEREISTIELRLRPEVDAAAFIASHSALWEAHQLVAKDKLQQQEGAFKMMQIEKWVTFLMLAFILVIALFNVVGSLTMLIIDKQQDAATLHAMGATKRMIAGIFMTEGWLISMLGAGIGTLFGTILVLIQQQYGLISMGAPAGQFIVDTYPVRLAATDLALILATVLLLGALAAYYPVRYATRNYWRQLR